MKNFRSSILQSAVALGVLALALIVGFTTTSVIWGPLPPPDDDSFIAWGPLPPPDDDSFMHVAWGPLPPPDDDSFVVG